MTDLDTLTKVFEHWGTIAAALTAIGICVAGIWKYIIKVGWDSLVEVHGFLTVLSDVAPTISKIAEEFRPNGGSTFRDALDRVEVQLAKNSNMATVLLQEAPDAVFITDGDGNCTWVNDAYTQWTGLSVDQAFGKGWHQAIAREDRENVFDEWDRAVRERANFVGHYNWTNGIKEFAVRCRTKLTIGPKGNLVGAIGVVKRLD